MISPLDGVKQNKKDIMTIQEYRTLLNDNISTEEQITKRLNYLEGFFRKRIRDGLQEYVKSKKNYN